MSRRKPKHQNIQQPSQQATQQKKGLDPAVFGAIIGAAALVLAAIIGLLGNIIGPVGPKVIEATQTAEAKREALAQTPTAPSPGNRIFEINFSTRGDGNCNDYDVSKLGYDTDRKAYYIIPNTGFVAVCHKDDKLSPEGILQTTAFPDDDSDYFGYAVFFGWGGSETKTTDACGFGVRKNKTKTEAIFVQIIGGNWGDPITKDLNNFTLDTNPHSVRMALYPSGRAVGYLDGNYVFEHSFVDCKTGPVGMIAYGPGKIKINFTSLKLFALP